MRERPRNRDHEASARIRAAARAAIDDPDEELAARMKILGELLDPNLAIIEKAVALLEGRHRLNTVERDRVADHIVTSLERKVLGEAVVRTTGSHHRDRMSLDGLINRPVAWAQRYANASAKGGMTSIQRQRRRTSSATAESPASASSAAEDIFLETEDDALITSLTEAVERWDRKRMLPSQVERAAAESIRALRGFPEPYVGDRLTRRRLEQKTETEPGREEIVRSLFIVRDLNDRVLAASETVRSVDTDVMDLWLDYTPADVSALAQYDAQVIVALVRGTVVFPSRPSEQTRRAIRRAAKAMSERRGWSSLVHKAERAWVAEYFAPASERDHRSTSAATSEYLRVKHASEWPAAAAAIAGFAGSPLGPGIRDADDVARWFENALYIVTTQHADSAQADQAA